MMYDRTKVIQQASTGKRKCIPESPRSQSNTLTTTSKDGEFLKIWGRAEFGEREVPQWGITPQSSLQSSHFSTGELISVDWRTIVIPRLMIAGYEVLCTNMSTGIGQKN